MVLFQASRYSTNQESDLYNMLQQYILNTLFGTSLVTQWLRSHTSAAGRVGSVPSQETKVSKCRAVGPNEINTVPSWKPLVPSFSALPFKKSPKCGKYSMRMCSCRLNHDRVKGASPLVHLGPSAAETVTKGCLVFLTVATTPSPEVRCPEGSVLVTQPAA